jgi:hypothetical protein
MRKILGIIFISVLCINMAFSSENKSFYNDYFEFLCQESYQIKPEDMNPVDKVFAKIHFLKVLREKIQKAQINSSEEVRKYLNNEYLEYVNILTEVISNEVSREERSKLIFYLAHKKEREVIQILADRDYDAFVCMSAVFKEYQNTFYWRLGHKSYLNKTVSEEVVKWTSKTLKGEQTNLRLNFQTLDNYELVLHLENISFLKNVFYKTLLVSQFFSIDNSSCKLIKEKLEEYVGVYESWVEAYSNLIPEVQKNKYIYKLAHVKTDISSAKLLYYALIGRERDYYDDSKEKNNTAAILGRLVTYSIRFKGMYRSFSNLKNLLKSKKPDIEGAEKLIAVLSEIISHEEVENALNELGKVMQKIITSEGKSEEEKIQQLIRLGKCLIQVSEESEFLWYLGMFLELHVQNTDEIKTANKIANSLCKLQNITEVIYIETQIKNNFERQHVEAFRPNEMHVRDDGKAYTGGVFSNKPARRYLGELDEMKTLSSQDIAMYKKIMSSRVTVLDNGGIYIGLDKLNPECIGSTKVENHLSQVVDLFFYNIDNAFVDTETKLNRIEMEFSTLENFFNIIKLSGRRYQIEYLRQYINEYIDKAISYFKLAIKTFNDPKNFVKDGEVPTEEIIEHYKILTKRFENKLSNFEVCSDNLKAMMCYYGVESVRETLPMMLRVIDSVDILICDLYDFVGKDITFLEELVEKIVAKDRDQVFEGLNSFIDETDENYVNYILNSVLITNEGSVYEQLKGKKWNIYKNDINIAKFLENRNSTDKLKDFYLVSLINEQCTLTGEEFTLLNENVKNLSIKELVKNSEILSLIINNITGVSNEVKLSITNTKANGLNEGQYLLYASLSKFVDARVEKSFIDSSINKVVLAAMKRDEGNIEFKKFSAENVQLLTLKNIWIAYPNKYTKELFEKLTDISQEKLLEGLHPVEVNKVFSTINKENLTWLLIKGCKGGANNMLISKIAAYKGESNLKLIVLYNLESVKDEDLQNLAINMKDQYENGFDNLEEAQKVWPIAEQVVKQIKVNNENYLKFYIYLVSKTKDVNKSVGLAGLIMVNIYAEDVVKLMFKTIKLISDSNDEQVSENYYKMFKYFFEHFKIKTIGDDNSTRILGANINASHTAYEKKVLLLGVLLKETGKELCKNRQKAYEYDYNVKVLKKMEKQILEEIDELAIEAGNSK